MANDNVIIMRMYAACKAFNRGRMSLDNWRMHMVRDIANVETKQQAEEIAYAIITYCRATEEGE